MKEIIARLKDAFQQGFNVPPNALNELAAEAAVTEEAQVAYVLMQHQIRMERLNRRTNEDLKLVVRY